MGYNIVGREDIEKLKLISSYQNSIRDVINPWMSIPSKYVSDLAIFYTYLICNAFKKLSYNTQFLLGNFLSKESAIRFCNLVMSDCIFNQEEYDFLNSIIIKVSSDDSVWFIKRSIFMLEDRNN